MEGDNDLHIFLDFDMGILGSSLERYQEYAKAIQFEYEPSVGKIGYLKGRIAFLEGYTKKIRDNPIYKVPAYFQPSNDSNKNDQAVQNMLWEVGDLKERLKKEPPATEEE